MTADPILRHLRECPKPQNTSKEMPISTPQGLQNTSVILSNRVWLQLVTQTFDPGQKSVIFKTRRASKKSISHRTFSSSKATYADARRHWRASFKYDMASSPACRKASASPHYITNPVSLSTPSYQFFTNTSWEGRMPSKGRKLVTI